MRKILLLVFCIICVRASSQTLFNVDADSMRFEHFVRTIEAYSDYYFYYDTAQVDKVSVTIHAKAKSLESILTKIFENTDLRFAIDDDLHVFVTGSFAIQTALPKNFLNQQTAAVDTALGTPQIELTGNSTIKEKAKILS